MSPVAEYRTWHKPILSADAAADDGNRWWGITYIYRYKISLLKSSVKALMVSTRTSIRMDTRGFLSMQYMIRLDDGQICFAEYFVSHITPATANGDIRYDANYVTCCQKLSVSQLRLPQRMKQKKITKKNWKLLRMKHPLKSSNPLRFYGW